MANKNNDKHTGRRKSHTDHHKHAGRVSGDHTRTFKATLNHAKIVLLVILIIAMLAIGSYMVADSVVSIQQARSDANQTSSSVWVDEGDTADNTGDYYDSLSEADGTPTAAPIKVKDPYATVDYGTGDDAYGGYSGGYAGDEMIIQRDEESLAIPTPLPTRQPTPTAGVIYQTIFHDEASAKYVAELTTQLESPTLYPTMRPTQTPAPTVLVTGAPTPAPTDFDAYDSQSEINGTASPTSAPTAMNLVLGSTNLKTQLDLSDNAVGAYISGLVSKSSSGALAVAVEGFGRLYRSSVGYLRLLVPEFRDKSFVLSTGEVNEDAEEVLSDDDLFNLIRAKLYQWSNKSYTINANGNVGVQRIGVPYKYKKRPSCAQIRKKLLKLAKKRDSSFTDDSAAFEYYAAYCYQGTTSSSMIELNANSLPMFMQQFASKLQWTGSSGSLMRTQSNKWSYLATSGDLLTASGGSTALPGVTHWGPEGFLPMQKHAFGWLSPKSYQQIIPSTQEVIYTIRTIREGTLSNSSLPSALVWRDLVYDTDVWFSFYESTFVFDTTYEDEAGDLAHGGGLGFAVHVPAEGGVGSIRTRLFGQAYQHSSGLYFKTLQYDRDYVRVAVTYKPSKQASVVPHITLSSVKQQSGTSSRISQTKVIVNLDRGETNIDQTTLDPFVLPNFLRVECPWGNFTNGASEDDLMLVGPSRLTAGSAETGIELQEYSTNLEAFTSTIVVSFQSKGELDSAEKATSYPCSLHIGQFLQKKIGIYFI